MNPNQSKKPRNWQGNELAGVVGRSELAGSTKVVGEQVGTEHKFRLVGCDFGTKPNFIELLSTESS